MAVKPFKTRLLIYVFIMVLVIAIGLILLLTGYEYSKSKGFHIAENRDPVGLEQALSMLTQNLIWYLTALVVVALLVEIVLIFFSLVNRKKP